MILAACSGHQFRLCRWFTYWMVFPPTTEKWNTRSARSWTPSWTDTADPTTDYTTWYSGQDTKGQMRKHHGYQPRTLPMHQNFTKCSTSDTQISQDHRTVNRSQNS